MAYAILSKLLETLMLFTMVQFSKHLDIYWPSYDHFCTKIALAVLLPKIFLSGPKFLADITFCKLIDAVYSYKMVQFLGYLDAYRPSYTHLKFKWPLFNNFP